MLDYNHEKILVCSARLEVYVNIIIILSVLERKGTFTHTGSSISGTEGYPARRPQRELYFWNRRAPGAGPTAGALFLERKGPVTVFALSLMNFKFEIHKLTICFQKNRRCAANPLRARNAKSRPPLIPSHPPPPVGVKECVCDTPYSAPPPLLGTRGRRGWRGRD